MKFKNMTLFLKALSYTIKQVETDFNKTFLIKHQFNVYTKYLKNYLKCKYLKEHLKEMIIE